MSQLTTYYLEMLNRDALRAKSGPHNFGVSILGKSNAELNRRLYQEVGSDWQWIDRLVWTEEQWLEYVKSSTLTTGLATIEGQSVGYFELLSEENGDTEIVQLGLLPDYVGSGLGGALVTEAIESAWSIPGTSRVWLHTCSRDHESALENYKRRGFTVYKTVDE